MPSKKSGEKKKKYQRLSAKAAQTKKGKEVQNGDVELPLGSGGELPFISSEREKEKEKPVLLQGRLLLGKGGSKEVERGLPQVAA